MRIWYEWCEDFQCNVFTTHAEMHPAYSQIYEDFNAGRADRHGNKAPAKYRSSWSIASDFPADHFVFFLEEDEKNFVEAYSEFLKYDPQDPPRAWKRPKNPEGFSWCDRCRVFHKVRDPNLPPLEEEISERLAAEIAREIDEEIIQELMKINEIRKTDP